MPTDERRDKTQVLIVDDEPAIRSTAVKILEKGGFSAVPAASAGDALDLLERAPFDILASCKHGAPASRAIGRERLS